MTKKQLDITSDYCPMTFVKTRLALEELEPGGILEVVLKAGEPLENVPRTVEEQGYRIVAIISLDNKKYRVTIEKPAVGQSLKR